MSGNPALVLEHILYQHLETNRGGSAVASTDTEAATTTEPEHTTAATATPATPTTTTKEWQKQQTMRWLDGMCLGWCWCGGVVRSAVPLIQHYW